MTTATKPRTESARDSIDRERDCYASKDFIWEGMLDEWADQCGDQQPNPANVRISRTAQLLACDLGFESEREIHQEIARHQRETTQAESRRSRSRKAAPRLGPETLDRFVRACNQCRSLARSKLFALEKINEEINLVTRTIGQWDMEQQVEVSTQGTVMGGPFNVQHGGRTNRDNFIFIQYAEARYPEALETRADGQKSTMIDSQKFKARVEWLRSVERPRLIAERDRLAAEWQKVVDVINAPIVRWARLGEAGIN